MKKKAKPTKELNATDTGPLLYNGRSQSRGSHKDETSNKRESKTDIKSEGNRERTNERTSESKRGRK